MPCVTSTVLYSCVVLGERGMQLANIKPDTQAQPCKPVRLSFSSSLKSDSWIPVRA